MQSENRWPNIQKVMLFIAVYRWPNIQKVMLFIAVWELQCTLYSTYPFKLPVQCWLQIITLISTLNIVIIILFPTMYIFFVHTLITVFVLDRIFILKVWLPLHYSYFKFEHFVEINIYLLHLLWTYFIWKRVVVVFRAIPIPESELIQKRFYNITQWLQPCRRQCQPWKIPD